jgi:hypothetical protein
MKNILTILLATLCAAASYGQTIKSLGFNSTNGQIVAATNVVWTNAFNFSTNTVAAQVRTNLGLGGGDSVTFQGVIAEFFTVTSSLDFDSPSVAAESRTNLGLGLPALTNTSNVTAMRALSGSTNTNHPFSGSVALTNTNVLVFSNGILQSVQ